MVLIRSRMKNNAIWFLGVPSIFALNSLNISLTSECLLEHFQVVPADVAGGVDGESDAGKEGLPVFVDEDAAEIRGDVGGVVAEGAAAPGAQGEILVSHPERAGQEVAHPVLYGLPHFPPGKSLGKEGKVGGWDGEDGGGFNGFRREQFVRAASEAAENVYMRADQKRVGKKRFPLFFIFLVKRFGSGGCEGGVKAGFPAEALFLGWRSIEVAPAWRGGAGKVQHGVSCLLGGVAGDDGNPRFPPGELARGPGGERYTAVLGKELHVPYMGGERVPFPIFLVAPLPEKPAVFLGDGYEK